MDRADVNLEGRLTRDPVSFGDGDKKRALFTVASNRGYGDNKRTVYVDCIAWGKRADIIMDNFTKGSAIAVAGDLEADQKPDSEDKSNKVRININNITPVGQLGGGGGSSSSDNSGRSRGKSSSDAAEEAEIPF